MRLIPDWETPKSTVLVYPRSIKSNESSNEVSREVLLPFYHQFIKTILRSNRKIQIDLLIQRCDDDIINNVDPLTDLIQTLGVLSNRLNLHVMECEDIWVRDFGPFSCTMGTNYNFGFKFKYNPSYHKGQEPTIDNSAGWCMNFKFYPNSPLVQSKNEPITWDGGNYTYNGNGTLIILDSIFRENPKWSKRLLIETIKNQFELEEVIVLPTQVDDEIGHIDGILRFISPTEIAIGTYTRRVEPEGQQYIDNLINLLKDKFSILEVPSYIVPDKLGKSSIESAEGCYINFLRIGDTIIVPQFGNYRDRAVVDILKSTGLNIIPTTYTEDVVKLARFGGVFNCITNYIY